MLTAGPLLQSSPSRKHGSTRPVLRAPLRQLGALTCRVGPGGRPTAALRRSGCLLRLLPAFLRGSQRGVACLVLPPRPTTPRRQGLRRSRGCAATGAVGCATASAAAAATAARPPGQQLEAVGADPGGRIQGVSCALRVPLRPQQRLRQAEHGAQLLPYLGLHGGSQEGRKKVPTSLLSGGKGGLAGWKAEAVQQRGSVAQRLEPAVGCAGTECLAGTRAAGGWGARQPWLSSRQGPPWRARCAPSTGPAGLGLAGCPLTDASGQQQQPLMCR